LQSETSQAIARIEALVNDLKNEGMEPFFIHTALATVMADLQPDVQTFVKALKK
jgi:hypothetical protein